MKPSFVDHDNLCVEITCDTEKMNQQVLCGEILPKFKFINFKIANGYLTKPIYDLFSHEGYEGYVYYNVKCKDTGFKWRDAAVCELR